MKEPTQVQKIPEAFVAELSFSPFHTWEFSLQAQRHLLEERVEKARINWRCIVSWAMRIQWERYVITA